jgi:hypothetical protein
LEISTGGLIRVSFNFLSRQERKNAGITSYFKLLSRWMAELNDFSVRRGRKSDGITDYFKLLSRRMTEKSRKN